MTDFEQYIRQGEPQQREKGYAWQTAIGLQAVDGLKISDYLLQTAQKHIEGDITIEEAKQLVDSYYQSKSVISDDTERTEEADKVSTRIAEILSEQSFNFSPVEYITIHKRLFEGIYKFAGVIRDYNIIKNEWVLLGATVTYGNAANLRETLDYDFAQEKRFSYQGISLQDTVKHLTKFVSDLWQIHPFGEGNTRTTALFTIKYLRTLGFDADNETFAAHSWYFRNALVRANYTNVKRGIFATTEYIELFFRNLLMGEINMLKNRALLINSTNNVGEVSEKRHVNVGEMSEKWKLILELISESSTISAKQLAERLNTTDRTIERYLKKMKELGIIERIGADRGGFWKINK